MGLPVIFLSPDGACVPDRIPRLTDNGPKPRGSQTIECRSKTDLLRLHPITTSIGIAISEMSKLSPSLKALVNASFARPGPTPAPNNIRLVYQEIAREAKDREFGTRPWLTLSVSLDIHGSCLRERHQCLPKCHSRQPLLLR